MPTSKITRFLRTFSVLILLINTTAFGQTISGHLVVCLGASRTTLSISTSGGAWNSGDVAKATIDASTGEVTGVSAGTAAITYTVPPSTYYTAVVTVNSLVISPIGFSTGSGSLCSGGAHATCTVTPTFGNAWSSSNPSVVTINTGGLLTSTSTAGTSVITYHHGAGNCRVTREVTVNPLPVVSLSTPMCVGTTQTVTATPSGGTWVSSSAGVAAINLTTGVLTGMAGGSAYIYYTSPAACRTITLLSVANIPSPITGALTFCAGVTSTLGSSPAGGTWSSTDGSIAIIGTSSGIVTGVSSGTATISYTLGSSCARTTVVTVNTALTSNTGPDQVCVGQIITLSNATSGGTWSSSATAKATVNIYSGVVTSVSAGTANISYKQGGCYSITVVTVDAAPAAITGATSVCAGSSTTLGHPVSGGTWSGGSSAVGIIGSANGIVTGVAPGVFYFTYTLPSGCVKTGYLTVKSSPLGISGTPAVCVGNYTLMSNPTSGGVWSSSNTSVATVVSSSGYVLGIGAGTTTISYIVSSTGCFATRTVTVNSTGSGISGPLGVCIGGTSSLSSSPGGGTWSSSSMGVATIGSASGIVSGVSIGASIISYDEGTGCISTATVTVNSAPGSIAGSLTVCAGSTTTLSNATSGGSWSSGSTGVATVGSASGVVTGVGSGVATISYTTGAGCYTTTEVTVSASSGGISGTVLLCAGNSTTLSGPGGGTWSSSNTSVATIGSTSGTVTAISAGTTTISYNTGAGCVSSVVVTVNGIPAAIGGTATVCAGLTTTLSNATSGGTWSSSNTGVATIGATSGIVSGVSAGTATISYLVYAAGCYAVIEVTVSTTLGGISDTSGMCVGNSTTLSSSASGGTWSSSNTGVATVGSSSGIVTGVSAGTSTISYSIGGSCFSTLVVSVTGAPASITGTTNVCAGATTTLGSTTSGGTWSSSSTGIATVGITSGIVTGVSAGTATITYITGAGCYTTAVVTVAGAPGTIGGSTAMCIGSTITLSSSTSGGTWASGNTSVATINPSSGVVTSVGVGTSSITYSIGSGCAATAAVTVLATPTPLTGTGAICVGATTTLSTTGGTYWTSSNTSVATVPSSSGIVTGVTTGTATIAVYNTTSGCTATLVVTVNTTPSVISGTTTVGIGGTTTLSSSPSGGTWSSSTPSIGTVASGAVTGIASGTTVITYALGSGCYRTTVVTVTVPCSISGTLSMCVGSSITLTSTVGGGSWTTSATGIATVGGSSGVVTGVSAGTATITYNTGTGCTSTAVVTVNSNPATITGSSAICVGSTATQSSATGGGSWTSSNTGVGTIGLTSGIATGISAGTTSITYTVATTGCYTTRTISVTATAGTISGTLTMCGGGTSTLSSTVGGGTWSSSATSVGTIGLTSGIFTAVGSGGATISYFLGSCVSTATATVLTTPSAITGTTTVCAGATTSLSSSGSGTWSSGTPSIATVSGSGVVTGIITGTATISHILSSGCFVSTVVTVSASPAAITGTLAMCSGATTTLSSATSGGTWLSGNTSVATVGSTSGVVTGVAAGNAMMYYSVSGCATTAMVTVNPTPVITGGATVCIGTTSALTPSVSGGSWSSGAPGVATVNTTGLVTGVSVGTAVITYMLPTTGCMTTLVVTVGSTPGTISGTMAMCAGSTSTLSFTGSGGTWSSGNASIATIGSTSGVVTGVAAGTATISYNVGGCTATTMVTVNAAPAGISGTTSLGIGDITVLTSATTGGTWSSSSTSVATIGSTTGAATGIGTGTATITYMLSTGCYATISLSVSGAGVGISGSDTIVIGTTILLSGSVGGGTWSSSEVLIATVGSSSGIVTGISPGTAIISYGFSPGVFATTVVTVSTTSSSSITSRVGVIAGTGTAGFSGDGGPATSANLNFPKYAITDAAGNIYVSDGSNHRIRKIDASGIITTIAGDGTSGYSGDGGDATAAKLNNPAGIALDASGNLYIADYTNHRIRKVNASGTISTYAGTGSTTPVVNGDPATATNLNTPSGLITDAVGNIYFTEVGGQLVRKITASTGLVSLIAGTGVAGFSGEGVAATASKVNSPGYLCLDGSGNLVISDFGNQRIRRINSSGIMNTIAGSSGSGSFSGDGGPATSARLNSPCGLDYDNNGNLIFADRSNNRIRKVDTSGIISTVAGTSSTGFNGVCVSTSQATFNQPMDVAVDTSGKIIVVDYNNKRVRRINKPVTITGLARVCVGATVTQTSTEAGGTWSSSNTSIATIGSVTGIVTGVANGTCLITYTYMGGCPVVKTMSVNPTSGTITFSGATAVCEVASTSLTPSILGTGTWTSSNASIATIGSITGVVTGVSAGTVIITYEIDNECLTTSATQIMTVNPIPSPITGTFAVCIGSTTTLADASSGGTWISSATSIATVGSSSGIATGVVLGTATISYKFPATGCYVVHAVTVDMNADTAFFIGGQFSVLENWDYGLGLFNGTTGITGLAGTWSSSNATIANVTIVTPGWINGTGLSAGTTTISFDVANACGSHTYTRALVVTPQVCDNVWCTVGGGGGVAYDGGSGISATSLAIGARGTPIVSAQLDSSPFSMSAGAVVSIYDGVRFVNVVNPDLFFSTGLPGGDIDFTYTAADTSGSPFYASSNAGFVTVRKWNGNDWEYYTGHYGGSSPIICKDRQDNFYLTYPDPVADGKATVVRYNGTGWDTLGGPGFSTNAAYGLSLTTDINGTPFVAFNSLFADPTYTDVDSLIVMKFNGSSWVQVGSKIGPVVPYYYFDQVSIKTNISGNPVVAYTYVSTYPAGGANLLAARYDGSNWVNLGSGALSDGDAENPKLGIDPSGIPYVAYNDYTNAGKITVKKYTGSWSTVGAAGFTGVAVGQDIAIDNDGTPYVSCAENYTADVWKFNGSNWVKMNGSAAVGDDAYDPIAMAMDVDTAYVSYLSNYKCVVKTLVGNSWLSVGAEQFSSSNPVSVTMAARGGIVYVGYVDASAANKVTVMKFNGSSWSALGGTGISAGTASFTDIAIDNTGVPYIVYRDAANGNKATVLKHDGSSWVALGGAGFSPGAASGTSIAIDGSGTPYVSFSDSVNGSFVTVMKYNGSAWVAVGAPGFGFPASLFGAFPYATTTTDETQIEIDGSGTPFVAFKGTYTVFVRKFNGTDWVSLSPGPDYQVATLGSSSTVKYSFALSSAGKPYLAYLNFFGGSEETKFHIVTFNGYDWVKVGKSNYGYENGITYGPLERYAGNSFVAVNSTGVPYLAQAFTNTGSLPGFEIIDIRMEVKKLGTNSISGNLSLCQGTHSYLYPETKSFLVAPGVYANGNWSSSNTAVAIVDTFGVVTGIAAGTATLSYVYGDCPTTVIVSVNALPSAGTISGASSVAIGSSITLSSTVTGGMWSTSNPAVATVGSSSGSVTGVAAGSVNITYVVAGACGLAVATHAVSVTTPRPGLHYGDDAGNGATIAVYPNPTSGMLNVETAVNGSVAIYTIDGRELKQYETTKGVTVIALPDNLATGIYMLRFKGDDGSTQMVRLVYER